MENYPSYSYPDSGDSSPRSREIDFENPPPSWEDSSSTLPPNYKVKFMVSYGGKIHPRSHDNLLSYVGGDTKILAVERAVKFNLLLSKLSSLISPDNDAGLIPNPNSFTFKYQLPGEDLDALISVTNDDDLEHMMHEYDRMSRASSKPARLRLFLFPNTPSSGFSSTSSDQGKLDPARFVEALHSVPDTIHPPPPPVAPQVVSPPPMAMNSNVDFLFGLENPVPVQAPVPVQVAPAVPVHEMNRLHVSAQEQQQQQHAVAYRQRSEENSAPNCAGDMYQKGPPPPVSHPASAQIPTGYWQAVEQHHQLAQQQQHQSAPQPQQPQQQQYHQPPQQQPVYMMQAPPQSAMYHAPVVRPPPQTQGYYQVQRMPSDPVYREPPVYSMPAPAPAPAPIPVTSNQVAARPVGESAGYQVGYDSTGRQVYYAAAPTGGVVTAPYQGVAGAAVSSGEMRGSGDGKVVQKVGATSASGGV